MHGCWARRVGGMNCYCHISIYPQFKNDDNHSWGGDSFASPLHAFHTLPGLRTTAGPSSIPSFHNRAVISQGGKPSRLSLSRECRTRKVRHHHLCALQQSSAVTPRPEILIQYSQASEGGTMIPQLTCSGTPYEVLQSITPLPASQHPYSSLEFSRFSLSCSPLCSSP